jgi:hypothetical protein
VTDIDKDPDGAPREKYGKGQIEQLIRAIVQRGQSIATYEVLAAAAEAAVRLTPARKDGLIYAYDVLDTLTTAMDAVERAKKELPHNEPPRSIASAINRDLCTQLAAWATNTARAPGRGGAAEMAVRPTLEDIAEQLTAAVELVDRLAAAEEQCKHLATDADRLQAEGDAARADADQLRDERDAARAEVKRLELLTLRLGTSDY